MYSAAQTGTILLSNPLFSVKLTIYINIFLVKMAILAKLKCSAELKKNLFRIASAYGASGAVWSGERLGGEFPNEGSL